MKNKLFVVSGASGSGKTTIMRKLMDNELVSFTTRSMRKGEIEGKDYIFISQSEFEYLLNNNGLIENTLYGGNSYGLTREEFEGKLSKSDCYFIADFNGMQQVKNMYPNCVTIFIYCKSEDVETNMRNRGDGEEQIQKRLSTYDQEILNMYHYDHVVVNTYGEFEETLRIVKDIIGGNSCSE